jgi:hypothetical protein
MLNVPGGARMRHTHFTAIEQELAKVEINVAQEAIRAGLDEEIKRTVNATMDLSYEEWVALPIKSRPRVGLAVSFDAGWQKRSSGNTYDSLSGHAAFYGQQTRLVIALAIMSKRCTTCDKAHELERKVPEHNCPKNHEGSSKSMEPLAAVKLLKFILRSMAEKGQTSQILMRIVLSFIGATGRNNRETYHLTNSNASRMPSLITCLMTTHSVVMSGVLC